MTIEDEREYVEAKAEFDYFTNLPSVDREIIARLHELEEAMQEWERTRG